MSIVAQTQKSLDELGVKSSQDLQRLVPSLRIGFNGANGPGISIRGIQGQANNAATTERGKRSTVPATRTWRNRIGQKNVRAARGLAARSRALGLSVLV